MKEKTFWIIAWSLMLASPTFLFAFKSMSLWEQGLLVVLWTFIGLLSIIRILRYNKEYTLHDNILIIRKTLLQQEQRHDLSKIASWTEYNYKFLGLETGRKIILKTVNGERIDLLDNIPDAFQKVSDYLNMNLLDLNNNVGQKEN